MNLFLQNLLKALNANVTFEDMIKKKIKSPCQLICTYDEENVCIGCYRTAEEVANWDSFNDEGKTKVLEEIIKRREEKGGSYYGFG
ncbi:MAG: DUF1289 domain-containing protein [Bacteroidales bacterium]|nr:DUF1289 domain-containing protein [Bacteroidales bacterium]